MSNQDIKNKILYPNVVALIGASGTKGRLTARPQAFMNDHGFEGRVYPVNPRRDEVQGVKAYPSISDIPEPVDHAYILLDAEPALAVLQDCGKAGVKVVSMLADGFAESGGDGIERQERLEKIAAEYGIIVIGPNSTGVVETTRKFVCTSNAAFASSKLPTGKFAVLSQSGSMIGAMLSRGAALGLGFKSYISVGNEACMGVGELGQVLVDDPEIEGFTLFLETLRRPSEIAKFARMAQKAGKPVIAYLVGRSGAGQSLAASHTGAMVGGGRAIEAFLDSHGIHRVENFEALVEMSNALRVKKQLSHRPKKVTVVTTTGGGGGMVYDLIGLRGVPMATMSDTSRAKLAEGGLNIKKGPLVDVTLAGTKYDTMKAVISTLINDPESGLIVTVIGSSSQFNPELAVNPIVDAVKEAPEGAAPVVAMAIPHAPESLNLFNANGVPAFRTGESAAEAIDALLASDVLMQNENTELSKDAIDRISNTQAGAMTEVEASNLFADLALTSPTSYVVGADNDIPANIEFEGPYVLKVVSRDVQHKSEIGGVKVGLADVGELQNALVEMRANVAERAPSATVDAYLVQKMEKGLGEAIIGLNRDPVVGPMITVGLGGVMTEIYKDISLRPAPVNHEIALEMLDEVKGFALLRGFRNGPLGDLEALAAAVVNVSKLAMHERVLEAEINPVLVREKGEGVILLDGLVMLGEKA
ncbi:MAG: acetate--CoA ligase family protein [Methylocystaceae bacterium]|nr:acetate--CoA ligase family protein [Methylocystaceae bacterium]